MLIFGVVVTVFWCFLIVTVGIINWDSSLATMPLNEWGDFLAGVSAPMAFLWLIISYNLQRIEFKENTKALRDQKDELSKQNENMEANTEATKELSKAIKFTGLMIKSEISTQGSNRITQEMLNRKF